MQRLIFALLLFVVAPAMVSAQVAIKDPWVRATVPEQKTTGAFMQLTSPTATRLVEARSPAAKNVEIHEMAMADNVMKMRAVSGLDLPAGKTVNLQSGSYHVMLVGLKGQIKAGDSVPITLVFEGKDKKRESVDVKSTARALGAPAAGMEHMKH